MIKNPRRRSLRLPDYDYTTPGAYFVTVCAYGNRCLFGEVADGRMRLNEAGRVVQTVWNELPVHYPNVEIDTFMVMPNHVHGIFILTDGPVGAGLKPAPTTKRHGLPEIVRAFKTFSSRKINKIRRTPGVPVWQRGYYEHLVRRTDKMNRIREYILNNPLRWELDRENPHFDKSGRNPVMYPLSKKKEMSGESAR